ncbi:MAG TPA: amidohydrolase family protein [Cytophagales bacterium]|nr:amidohydrolase family protein [Cytophagales bacterium]
MRSSFLFMVCGLATLHAQETILWNAEVHTGAGKVLPRATVVVEGSKIKKIITEAYDTTGKHAINLTGKQLYPGFIAPCATIGLTELASVRGQNDYKEVGTFNPNVRTLIAYNTDSEIIPTLRQNGVLMAHIAPKGELIAGQSSVVTLYGHNWEDAAYKADIGIHLFWPSKYIGYVWWEDMAPKANDKYSKQIQEIERYFSDAQAYAKEKTPERKNLKLEAMKGLYDSTKTLFVHAHLSSQITEAVLFCKRAKVKKVVIVGALDAEDAIPLMAENKIPVIFTRVHSLPAHSHSDIRQAYKMPRKLQDANLLYCLSYEGDMEAMGTRNLPFTAGSAVAYGLSKEQALSSITYNTARILGIDQSCGSIAEGKDATLFVSEGDALDMIGNKVVYALIKGVRQELRSRQDDLYDTYKNKSNAK